MLLHGLLLVFETANFFYCSNAHVSGLMPDAACCLLQAILQFICESANQLAESGRRSPVQLSFYAVTVCEVVASGPAVSHEDADAHHTQLVSGLMPA